ncbi:glycoside hydrolase family 16 [Mycobacterium sp. MS1601]|uniref:glycoside hydrolase family 16 protein n=1 Tax=Mycobacterium sp. MS1601 TaxID=1936029 RepID=UPI0009792DAC|nr:glycoside hydrolase family 16 protein [Mycobacterium sp. MS1601]AQA05428.1 glycoside hydrolase family 16 [Mycobacterium sp. MS1601]
MTTDFIDRFHVFDADVWTAAYLPAWSSRAAAAATFTTGVDGLDLSIPAAHPLWCPDQHSPPLRVSGIQSVNRSGPVGSTDAPQPFLDGQRVREYQPTVLGFAPHFGRIEVTCAAELKERSMFSAWMVGLEDQPDRCGEICLMEVFGNTVADGYAEVGQGIHRFRDPALREDFSAPRRRIDITTPHRYAVHWSRDRVEFSIDGVRTRTADQAPDYPMLLFLAVFDFPEQSDAAGVPHLRVSEVRGTDLGEGTLLGGQL